jgi:UDP-N-acetylmuramoyl-L-alanyl-D-glutamate--2,6-diaminopimelate ligase
MTKNLKDLLKALDSYQISGKKEVKITGVSDDSRKVVKGNLYVAISGFKVDGHNFIPQAIKSGAVAIVGEKDLGNKLDNITYVRVSNSRAALGYLASDWYGNPSRYMDVIGVTGTDGKTTTCNILYWILTRSGIDTGLVTTINARIGSRSVDTGFHVTNPEPLLLQKILWKIKNFGCKYVCLEVTSHGLDQSRVAGVKFDTAVLTNITHEHLDYHTSFQEYKKAKAKLFKKVKTAVLNKDDKSYTYFKSVIPGNATLITYAVKKEEVDYKANNINYKDGFSRFDIVVGSNIFPVKTKLSGVYNVENVLAAVAVARHYKVSWKKIRSALASFKTPIGRLEEIDNNRGIRIYIDFAHTPNSLEKVLTLLRKEKSKRVISVFGCAAERDIRKRPMMGEVSARYADISIFTAEDPRFEDINTIIKQMAKGAKKAGANQVPPSNYQKHKRKCNIFIKVPERGEAIAFAINKVAEKGDIVVICGKGHEKSMSYNGVEYDWSDHEAVKMALEGKMKTIKRK